MRKRLALPALLAVLLGSSARGQAPGAEKHVILVYSHNPNAPGLIAFTGQFKSVMAERFPSAVLYEEHMEAQLFPDIQRRPELVRYFAGKYRDVRPDAIIVEGTPALRLVIDQLREVFPNLPVVYGGVFERGVNFDSLPAYVTGRRLPMPFASTYSLIHALQPETERVVVVGGSSRGDSALIAEARRQITPLLEGTKLESYQDWTYESLIDSLRHFPPRTVVLFSDFTVDKTGVRRFIPGDIVGSLARVASVPTYGIAKNWIGDGIVGGGVMDFADEGRRTADLLIRVLERRPREPLPESETAVNKMVVDWRQLHRWSIPESRLPPNTGVAFQPMSMWQRNRISIVVAVVLFAIESGLIALLLLERSQRKRAQQALVSSRAQVEHMGRVATLNSLASAVSHELRQPLAAIRLNAEAGQLLLGKTPPDVAEVRVVLEEIGRDEARAAEVVEHYRALLRQQTPATTLIDVNSICRNTAKLVEPELTVRRARLKLQLDPDGPEVMGDPVQLQQALINLTLNAIEAISNVPTTREVVIRTDRKEKHVEIHVCDTGPGLDPGVRDLLFEPFFSTKPHGLGMGATIVRAIVERHHGSLRADNRPGGGAEFTITMPAA